MNALEERLANELARQSNDVPTAQGDSAGVHNNGRRRLLVHRAARAVSAAAVAVMVIVPIALMSGNETESSPVGGTEQTSSITSEDDIPTPVLTPFEHTELLAQCLLDAGFELTVEGTGITIDNRVVDEREFEGAMERCDAGLIEAGYKLGGDPFVVSTP